MTEKPPTWYYNAAGEPVAARRDFGPAFGLAQPLPGSLGDQRRFGREYIKRRYGPSISKLKRKAKLAFCDRCGAVIRRGDPGLHARDHREREIELEEIRSMLRDIYRRLGDLEDSDD